MKNWSFNEFRAMAYNIAGILILGAFIYAAANIKVVKQSSPKNNTSVTK